MKKRGVSLIVLTITILVMIMLAAVVILSLSKNNSVDKAGEAIFMQDLEELNSSLAQTVASLQIQNTDVNPENISESLLSNIRKYIPEFPDEYIGELEIYKGRLIYVGTESEKISWAKKIKATKEQVDGTVFANYTRDKEKSRYNLPYVPNKFVALSCDKALVISDSPDDENKSITDASLSGNQYVWIPVDGIKIKFATDYTNAGFNYVEGDGIDMARESVAKYGGFYIARYEGSAGVVPETGAMIIQSKKGQPIINGFYYKFNEMFATDTYKEEADIATTLPYGAMWDTTCKWLVTTGQIPLSAVTKSAIGYGVYSTSAPKLTGSMNSNAIIQDMAGNGAEWTKEIDAKNRMNNICRGGSHKDNSATGATYGKRESVLGGDAIYGAKAEKYITMRMSFYIK